MVNKIKKWLSDIYLFLGEYDPETGIKRGQEKQRTIIE